ncbi:MAG: ribosome-binding factor A [Planctomycetia bacterium]|jgi:ribosome-binding factor A
MTLDKRTRRRLLDYCGELHEDDAVDPREYFKEKRNTGQQGRKSQQLCHQVATTLDMILSGECSDERLQSLHVLSVDPAPDTTRLLVTVESDLPPSEFDHLAILTALAAETGHLRTEIAQSIHRKKVPALVFNLVPMKQAE